MGNSYLYSSGEWKPLDNDPWNALDGCFDECLYELGYADSPSFFVGCRDGLGPSVKAYGPVRDNHVKPPYEFVVIIEDSQINLWRVYAALPDVLRLMEMLTPFMEAGARILKEDFERNPGIPRLIGDLKEGLKESIEEDRKAWKN